jgi:hypothetical protein
MAGDLLLVAVGVHRTPPDPGGEPVQPMAFEGPVHRGVADPDAVIALQVPGDADGSEVIRPPQVHSSDCQFVAAGTACSDSDVPSGLCDGMGLCEPSNDAGRCNGTTTTSTMPPLTNTTTTLTSSTTTTLPACTTVSLLVDSALHGRDCEGTTVPSKIITRLRRAVALVDAADQSPRKSKARSLLRGARHALQRAGKMGTIATWEEEPSCVDVRLQHRRSSEACRIKALVTEQVKTLRTSGMGRSVNVRENPVHPEDPVHPSYRPRRRS